MGDSEGMKVLHVGTELSWRGGEQQIAWLIEGLLRRKVGPQWVAAPAESELARRCEDRGWPVLALDVKRGGWDRGAARRLGDFVREKAIDIVHAHTSHAHTVAWLGVARRGLAPVVATRRVDFAIARGLLGAFRRAKYVDPRVRLIAISEGVRDVLVRGGVARERVAVVPSGIDSARLDGHHDPASVRRELDADERTAVIGDIGALTDHKGQTYLIRAAAILRDKTRALDVPSKISSGLGVSSKFSDFRIALVGEGEDRPALEAEIARLDLARHVRLLGFRNDIPACLRAFDFYCVASHLEGLGTSMLDAMWTGLPVVATRTGGITDAVIDDENGLLVPPRDPEALARAILRLMESPETGRRLGERAHRTVQDRFTVDRMVEGTLAVYREFVAT